jgi:hypothetical protein
MPEISRFVKLARRKNRQFFRFLHACKSNSLFRFGLERKKRAFLPLLVIHQKHAAQKFLKYVFEALFRLRQTTFETPLARLLINSFLNASPPDFTSN